MNGHGYIYVRNWDRFQHYKDRRPVWIKLYVALLDDDDYLSLTLASRGLLHDIWMLTAVAGNGRVRCRSVSGECQVSVSRDPLGTRLNVRRVSLEPLIHAGFIEVRASKSLAEPYEVASTETETEKEVEQKNHVHPKQDRQARGHVWSAYEAHHPDAQLTTDRKRLIDTRLNQGYTPQQLVAAIEGNHRDPYCNGENTSGKQYHALELILRNADKIEQYANVPALRASAGAPRPPRELVTLEHIRTEELIKRGIPK